MEFRVDITGDPSGATQGAAALRAETSAARDTSAALALVGRGQSALATAGRGAEQLAAGLREAQRETSALKAARDAVASGGKAVDIETYRTLSDQIEAATTRSGDLAAALAKTGRAGEDFEGNARAKEKADKEQEKAEEKRQRAAEKAAAEDEKRSKDVIKGTKDAAKETQGAATEALRYAGALAGIGGAAELTKLAIGWRGMAALQMISMRAMMDVRRLFLGLDSSPLVRAASMLEKNLSTSTVTGKALSGILQRGFGAFFGMIERGAPLIQAVFEGMVIGALEAEIAVLKARVALAPLTVAIEDWLGSEHGMETAAAAGKVALLALGLAATEIAAPFIAAAAAIGLVAEATVKVGHAYRAAKRMMMSPEERQREDQAQATNDAWNEHVARTSGKQAAPLDSAGARAVGVPTGNALGEGIAAGMDQTAALAAAAGGRVVDAANKGARTRADAHSPSELMRKGVGRDLGAGVAAGVDDSAPGVQRAADRSLVPDVPKIGAGSAGAGGTAGAGAQINLNFYFPALTHGDPEAIRAAVSGAPLREGLRQLTIALGLPLPVAGATS